MSLTALALVLAAAVLHTTWNLLAKAGADAFAFLWLLLMTGTLAFTPFIIAAGWRGELAEVPWILVAATSLVHAVHTFSLSQAYRYGHFSQVYPLSRGLGVALVPVFAFVTLGETLTPAGVLGVALVIAGILVMTRSVRAAPRETDRAGLRKGMSWALLTGVCTGVYSTIDSAAARVGDPVVYVALLALGSGLLISPAAWQRRRAVVHEWRANRRRILVAATMNLTAYLLVMLAMRSAKTGYVVAGRETSIVMGAAVGTLVLKEGTLRTRLPGALMILAGVACITLGG